MAVKFYGFSHKEVMQMPVNRFEMYWQAMQVIDAQLMLQSLTVSDYPNSGKETRKKIHRQLHKMAYPATWNAEKKITLDEFFGKPMVKNGE